jgi:hypothetical protein
MLLVCYRPITCNDFVITVLVIRIFFPLHRNRIDIEDWMQSIAKLFKRYKDNSLKKWKLKTDNTIRTNKGEWFGAHTE